MKKKKNCQKKHLNLLALSLSEKCSNAEFFLVCTFALFGTEKNPYLDFFHAVWPVIKFGPNYTLAEKIWGGNVRWTTSVEHMFKQSSKNTKIKSSICLVSKNQSIKFSLKSKFWSHQNHLWSTALLLSVNKK